MTADREAALKPPDPIQPLVFAEQVEMVYRLGPTGILPSVLNGVLMTYVLRGVGAKAWIWFAFLLATQTLRFALIRAFQARPPTSQEAPLWARRMRWTMGLSGSAWGLLFLILPAGPFTLSSALAWVLVAQAAWAGVLTLSPVRGLYFAYLLPLVLSLTYWLGSLGPPLGLLLGVYTLLGCLLSMGMSRRHQTQVEEALRIKHENRTLVTRLDQTVRDLAEAMQTADSARIIAELEREDAHEARALAEQASHAKSAFLANMSHEIRTPMNAILGFAELMRRDADLSATQKENLAIIQRSGDALLDLINGILDLSKIEAGKLQLEEDALDLQALVAEVGQLFRLRAQEKGLAFACACAPNCPRWVLGDAGKLRQILINLVGNALKFTAAGRVALEARVEDGRLCLAVADTGPGMSEEDQTQLFQAFEQTRTGRAARQGTGLGLALSQRLAHLMGGEIQVASRLGEGSTFTLRLPLPVATLAKPDTDPPRGPILGLAEGQGPWTLLVADDMAESRAVLSQFLSAWGFTVVEATQGQEAVDRWQAHQPDLVFMDMRMPVMNGREATQRIKALSGGRALVVAQSASAFEEELDSFLQAGCDRSLRKPIRTEEVVQVLEELLGARFVREDAGSPAEQELPSLFPPETRPLLKQALLEGDLVRVRKVAEDLQGAHPHLAARLTRMAETFDFAGLQGILDA